MRPLPLSGVPRRESWPAARRKRLRPKKSGTKLRRPNFARTVDSTKTESVEVTYTKIEFFRRNPILCRQSRVLRRRVARLSPVADTPKNRPKEQKEKQPPDNGRQGAIKSIETFTVRQKTEAAGVTQEEQKTETTKTEEVNTDTDRDTDITEKPAADPYRWRYIFGILVLLAVAFFFLRKTKVFTAVAAFFRKLF